MAEVKSNKPEPKAPKIGEIAPISGNEETGIRHPASDIRRIKTGIEGFDELVEGGIEAGSSALIVGSAGTGKSTFALQFLYEGAVKFNEPGIYISFEETGDSLKRHALRFGWDFAELEKRNLFRIMEYQPHQVEKLMGEGGGPIRDLVHAINAKRLVVDSITTYSLLFRDEYQKREALLKFFDLLKKWGCTSFILSELSPKLAEEQEGSVGFLTDSIISLYYQPTGENSVRVHTMEILKMRGTKHTNKVCVINFDKNGLKIYPDIEVL